MNLDTQPMVENINILRAQRIREAISGSGLKPREIALGVGVSLQMVYRWQKHGKISGPKLKKLADMTRKTVDFFYGGDAKPATRNPDDDLAEVFELLQMGMPPEDFPMDQKERLGLAREIVRKYYHHNGAASVGKILRFISQKKERYRGKPNGRGAKK